MHPNLDRIDVRVARWMHRHGHRWHRLSLGVLFVWLGLLKFFGHKTGTSLIGQTIYLGEPELMTLVLGGWEVLVGVCLFWVPLVRLALPLLAVRLPGTLLALILKSGVCFDSVPFVPTIEGQYLLKDLALFSAAMVIGGTVRDEPHGRR
jgi:uncharacterized membrane protein YkgB